MGLVADGISHVFAYGTLQRGQLRAGAWPFPPRSIRRAVVLGQLYDLQDYPALTPGTDRVGGELWEFTLEQMPRTLEVLDAIEGYAESVEDLYRRVVVSCQCDGVEVAAFTYHYVRPLEPHGRVSPRDGLCCWPPSRTA